MNLNKYSIHDMKKRLHEKLRSSDVSSMKQALVDWVMDNDVDVDQLKVDVSIMEKVIGLVQCKNPQWLSLELYDLSTTY